MAVRGLKDYRLTVAGLEKLGMRPVTFSVQLKGVPLHTLTPLSPRRRDARLRVTLKRQLASLTRQFPEAGLKSRDARKGSWTLDGSLPANRVRRLAERPEVSELCVSAIEGHSPSARSAKAGWFCVWGVVAIQVEGQRSGMMKVEDRLVLVKASGVEDAVNRLAPAWREYAEPYLNPDGYLVRWHLVEIKDVFALFDDSVSPEGTEVYSRLRTVKLKSEYQWRPHSAPNKRLQRTPLDRVKKRRR
jgi:Domain of unknown function (DUF4288)